ncbi:MAG TPA: DUF6644 family protein [Croceibacterium sp.]
MIDAALTALAHSVPAEALRASFVAYPLVNVAHVLGLAVLFGSILALDLRLLGFFASVPAQPLARVLPIVWFWGIAIAIPTGVLLFSVDPQAYLGNLAFRTKLMLVALGIVHAATMPFSRDWAVLMHEDGTVHPRMRVTAVLSLTIWTSAIVSGRLIAYVSWA